MPAALPIDWEHAKLLRFQGLSYGEISRQLNIRECTVAGHARRHKWSEAATRARQQVAESVQGAGIGHVARTLADRAAAWSEGIVADVEHVATIATKLRKPKSRKGLREHEELMALHTKRGRTMFGLDQDSANINITIGVPRGMTARRITDAQVCTSDAPSDAPPAIDV